MLAPTDDMKVMDPGLAVLEVFLRLHGVAAEAEQIRRTCGTAPIGVTQMVRGAKKFGVQACMGPANWERLSAARLPGIAALRDGGFLIIDGVNEDRALVLRPSAEKSELMTRAEFESAWNGRIVVTGRASLLDFARGIFQDFTGTWKVGLGRTGCLRAR